MELYVRLLGDNVPLVVQADRLTNVLEFKGMVGERFGLPADQQRLVFAGQEMEDEKVLADYNICTESTLHLLMKP